jgi:hypothetical protein
MSEEVIRGKGILTLVCVLRRIRRFLQDGKSFR